jgi:predicted nucleotidyltransferase
MRPQSVQEKIQEMTRLIVDRFHPEKIILFGSHARGTAGPDSDVDLMIVMPLSGSRRRKQIEVRVALHNIRMAKDIIVVTPEDIEKRKDIVGTVIRPAVRDGKVLYDKKG